MRWLTPRVLLRRKTELRARDGVSEGLRYETPTDQMPQAWRKCPSSYLGPPGNFQVLGNSPGLIFPKENYTFTTNAPRT